MKKIKRILFLTFYFPPDLCAGSFRAGALLESLAPMAAEKNIAIDVITTQPNRYANFLVSAPEIEKKDNVTIHRIKIGSHRSGFVDQAKAFSDYFLMAQKIVKKESYDLVYATSSRLFTAFLGARISTKNKKPLFLDMRDIFTDTMASLLKFPWKGLLPVFNFIERYTIQKADTLNVVSDGFIPHFSGKKNKRCEMTHFSHGVDPCFYHADYQKTDISKIKRVLYAGNIGQGQGMEKIIPSLAKIFSSDCEFVIIGNGGRLAQLQKACEHLPNVQILPPVERQSLVYHYQQADILFLHLNDVPAFRKVLPSKLFEYAQTGKPILAGISGFSAEFMRAHIPDGAIFSPGDIEQATVLLKQMLENQQPDHDRDIFYQQFNREALMKAMAEKIVASM